MNHARATDCHTLQEHLKYVLIPGDHDGCSLQAIAGCSARLVIPHLAELWAKLMTLQSMRLNHVQD